MSGAEYAEILTVRPGITDPASLKFRDEARHFCGMPPIRREMYLTHILPEKVTLGREYATPVSDGGCASLILRTVATLSRVKLR